MDKDKLITVETAVGREQPTKPPRVERRRSKRFVTELQVRLCWSDEASRVFEGSGVVRNVSAGGFGVEFSQRLPVDQILTVKTLSSSLPCVVRHVQEKAEGVLIGMQVLQPFDDRMGSLERLSTALEVSQRRLQED